MALKEQAQVYGSIFHVNLLRCRSDLVLWLSELTICRDGRWDGVNAFV